MRRDELTRETISHLNWRDKDVSRSSGSDTHTHYVDSQIDDTV